MPEAPTLLVVDDEPQLLRLLVRIFESRGWRVFSASDATQAWTVFEAHHDEIGVVVLDVVIPPDGVDPLLSRILGLREDVGVVLTSGQEVVGALRERLEALGGAFLHKPFSAESAHRAVARVTAR